MYVYDIVADADPFNLDAKLSADKNQDPAVAKSNKALAEEDGGEFSEEMKDFDPTKFEDDFIKAGAIGLFYGFVVLLLQLVLYYMCACRYCKIYAYVYFLHSRFLGSCM